MRKLIKSAMDSTLCLIQVLTRVVRNIFEEPAMKGLFETGCI
jgi:hypothetical protein